MPLQIGDTLGRYTLLKRLAAGGMGEVYLAAKAGPVGFGPRVALKILRDELASDQQFVDMLVDEANISMFLNHQNVVSVLDLSEDNGTYYIAMEFVQGVTVEQILEKLLSQGQKLDLSLGLFIAQELCRALKYAHTRVNHAGEPLNIIHRDVTPANILLSVQGEVKLTDFGIARAKGRIHQTQAGVLKGKFGYMAPEMIRYEEIDARADLFCAGVCIYLMVTGRHPVAGATVMEAIQRYEDKQIPRPSQVNSDVPSSLDQIIIRALEPKPDNRWASAAALGAALQDVVLKNPMWRREVQDGATRLADLIREIRPEAFQDPIPPDVAERMLKEALAREGQSVFRPEVASASSKSAPAQLAKENSAETSRPEGPKPPTNPPVPRALPRRAMSGPTTDREAEALEPDRFNATTHEAPVPSNLKAIDVQLSDLPFANDPPMVANPELETEEGLALADIYAARSELKDEYERAKEASRQAAAALDLSALRRDPASDSAAGGRVSLKKSAPRGLPSPDTGDLMNPPPMSADDDDDSDDVPTGLAPVEKTVAFDALSASNTESAMAVQFPDSSTDRNRMHDEMIEEQELPSKQAGERGVSDTNGGGSGLSLDDGRTVVGMLPLSDPAISQVEVGDTDENKTLGVVGMDEPELPGIGDELSLDDGKTVAGMQIPNWDLPSDEFKAPMIAEVELPEKAAAQPRKNKIDPEATRAYSTIDVMGPRDSGSLDLDDAETMIPPGPEGHDIDPNEWITSRKTERSEAFTEDGNDQTLLDGIDKQALSAAIQKKKAEERQKQRPTVLKTPDQPIEDEPDMDQIIADSFKTGKFKGAPSGPQLLDGPVRIVVGQDGAPRIGPNANTDEAVAQAPTGLPSAAAALAANAQVASASQKRKPLAAKERPQKGPTSERTPNHPSSSRPVEEPEVGMQTGRWIAGELDAAQLQWDDDAAARRAVATRNKATIVGPGVSVRTPQHASPSGPGALSAGQARLRASDGGPNPSGIPVVQGQPAPPSVSVMGTGVRYPGGMVGPDGRIIPVPGGAKQVGARNWMAVVALIAAFLAVLVVFGVLFFTRVLWPKLKLESDPPGATVVVDEVQAEQPAPVTVKVEPEKPHIVEFRLEGYRTERREISDGVGRGRTYTLQVGLRRILPSVDVHPVDGTVFVNNQKAGRGSHVVLSNLPQSGDVKIRVEADGYLPWEFSFERPGVVPESMDATLRPDPTKNPAPSPQPPKKR
jgi:serine/threonine protein kinase